MVKFRFLFIFLFLLITSNAFAQEGDPLTQEVFATELISVMNLERLLPGAALPSDCVAVLESLGVSPMGGWRNKDLLSREDYFVLIGKAQGRETLVHKRAVDVEMRNIENIDKKWQQAFEDTGHWLLLSELLNDSRYFPNGPPRSPYHKIYKDKDGDHKVDPIFLPAAELQYIRATLTVDR